MKKRLIFLLFCGLYIIYFTQTYLKPNEIEIQKSEEKETNESEISSIENDGVSQKL